MRSLATDLQQELPGLEQYGYGAAHNSWVMAMLRERCAGTPVRAYFVAKAAECLLSSASTLRRWQWRGKASQKLLSVQLPLIFEGVITVQYLHNQILDRKSGVTTAEAVSRNLLAANLLKEQLYRYIDGECPPWAREAVVRSVRRAFELVDLGQHIEQQWNTTEAFYDPTHRSPELLSASVSAQVDLSGADVFIEKIKRDLPRHVHGFVDDYFHRIYLTCAALFVEATELLVGLLNVPDRQAMVIRQFSLCYGLMRQLVNDNADWVPSRMNLATKAKEAEDAFSDLRNGTVTLPLIFLLASDDEGLIQDVARGEKSWSGELEEAAFEQMLNSGALFKSIQNARILGELAIAHLPLNEPAAALLADSCEIVHWNKFLAPCLRHPAYGAYRKTAYHQRTRRLIRRLRQERQAPAKPALQQQPLPELKTLPGLPPAVLRARQLLLQETFS